MAGILKVDQYQDFNGNNIMTSDGSGNITLNAAAMKSTPAFEANRATDLTLTDNTTQKMTYDTEIFDTDNCYDATTNYRFTPTVAGKYYVYASLNVQASTATTLNLIFLEIHKNGTKYRGTINNMNANFTTGLTPYVGTVIEMNGTTDYVEVYIRPAVNSGTVKSDNADNVFGAYKLIGV